MKIAEEKETGIYAETRKARAHIFDFKYNDVANNIFHGNRVSTSGAGTDPYGRLVAARQAKIDSFKKTNPPLLSYDKALFNEYIEMVRSRFLYLKVENAEKLRRSAGDLIDLLNKKYDLKDE